MAQAALKEKRNHQASLVELVGGTDVVWPQDDYFAATDYVNFRINDFAVEFYDRGEEITKYDWRRLRRSLLMEVDEAYAGNDKMIKDLRWYIGTSEDSGRVAALALKYRFTGRPVWIEEYRV